MQRASLGHDDGDDDDVDDAEDEEEASENDDGGGGGVRGSFTSPIVVIFNNIVIFPWAGLSSGCGGSFTNQQRTIRDACSGAL